MSEEKTPFERFIDGVKAALQTLDTRTKEQGGKIDKLEGDHGTLKSRVDALYQRGGGSDQGGGSGGGS